MAFGRVASASRLGGDGGADDLLRTYLDDIGRVALLTPAEEAELSAAIRAGQRAATRLEAGVDDRAERRRLEAQVRAGDEAKWRFVRANLRLVVSVAKVYRATGIPLADLVQEGNIGLIRAVEKFDDRKGFRFSTYAVWWIRQAIGRGVAQSRRSIRLPVHANDELLRLLDAERRLEDALRRPPTQAELVRESGLSADRVAELLPFRGEPASLSESVGEDDGAELADFVEDTQARAEVEAVTSHLTERELDDVLAVLDRREREVVLLRFGFGRDEPLSRGDVADRFGLSRERIRQIEQRALAKLRHPACEPLTRRLLVG